MEIARQIASRQEDLGEEFDDVRRSVQRALETRRRSIIALREYAIRADSVHQRCAADNRNANITGALGGGFVMIAGGITAATGGLAAPIVIGGLILSGAACSITGGAWFVKNEYDKGQRSSELLQEVMQQLAEDDQALYEMNHVIRRMEEGDLGYNAYHNHYEAQKESQLGKELRVLADSLEACLFCS